MKIIEKTYRWNGTLARRGVTRRIILHHAAAVTCSADQIHAWHLANGWSGIGYHFFVRKDGTVYRGRPEDTVGAHAGGSNSDSIGVCFEGSFDKEEMSAVQRRAGTELVAYLKKKYGVTTVQRHSDVNATGCPGTHFPFDAIAYGRGNHRLRQFRRHRRRTGRAVRRLCCRCCAEAAPAATSGPYRPCSTATAATAARWTVSLAAVPPGR